MDFSIELAQDFIKSDDCFPVAFDKAWAWLGYSRKDSAKRALLTAGFVENEDFHIEKQPITKGIASKYTTENIFLTNECFQKWAAITKVEKSRQTLGFIYGLEDKANKAVKIGFSTSVDIRVKGHQANPFLKEIFRFPVQSIKVESNLHKILSPHRISGTKEWYWFSDTLISVVESVLTSIA